MNCPEPIRTVFWRAGRVVMIDQRRLPHEERWLELATVDEVAEAITTMAVRGAPAIGVTAALGLALAATRAPEDEERLAAEVLAAGRLLVATRPTAVNLAWGVERIGRVVAARRGHGPGPLRQAIVDEAVAIVDEDVALCRRLGAFGAVLVPDEATILTHCNAGALATAGHGTALGVVRSAVELGKKVRVVADETRPFLQGARLTAWELHRDGIDVTVVSDVVAPSLLASGRVDLVVVGADRIAANGDTANKVGTLGVALAAAHAGVPFYVAAPFSTVDLATPDGAHIPIEERPAREVTHVGPTRIVPEGVPVLNPAFDVTPAALVTAFITDRGVVRPPFADALRGLATSPPT